MIHFDISHFRCFQNFEVTLTFKKINATNILLFSISFDVKIDFFVDLNLPEILTLVDITRPEYLSMVFYIC